MSIVIAQKRKSGATKGVEKSKIASTDEVVAFCPKCKTLETLWFTGDVLVQTQKFSQKDTRVYHDCGSIEPCRLFASFPKKV